MVDRRTQERPRLLDLFCGAGGAAVGYHRAGFDVVGVDIKPQPRYPFEFHQEDALVMLGDMTAAPSYGWWGSHGFEAVHASPPCQAYSALNTITKAEHPELVEPTRELLKASGLPWVMENVPGAPMDSFVTLCGSQFGLQCTRANGDVYELRRHRLFELSWTTLTPPCAHGFSGGKVIGVYGNGDGGGRGFKGSFADRKAAMDIDWMDRNELAQAVPPAYTEWIGAQLRQAVTRAA